MFTPYLLLGKTNPSLRYGFVDNKYSNGADNLFVDYMDNQQKLGNIAMQRFSYAGWNTDGNTLGCAISNAIVLYLFNNGNENTRFNSLRILEDKYYQVIVRTGLENYVNQIIDTNETVSNLQPDLDFYQRYVFKILKSYMYQIQATYNLTWELSSIYFPWNRTFEIGLLT